MNANSSDVRKATWPAAGTDHIEGPLDARIALVEYGDYECPHCGAVYPIIKEIQQRLGDRLCFAFRNFPLVNAHPHAEHAAEAAEAAAAQGKFWQMHDLLFENQDALEDDDLAGYAVSLGLDADRLIEEVESGAYKTRIRDEFRGGVRNGVNGTPTLFINGGRYDGDRSVEGLLGALIEAEKRIG